MQIKTSDTTPKTLTAFRDAKLDTARKAARRFNTDPSDENAMALRLTLGHLERAQMACKLTAKGCTTVDAAECNTFRMGTKSGLVIHEGFIKRWVGIGWVEEGPAMAADFKKLPIVI